MPNETLGGLAETVVLNTFVGEKVRFIVVSIVDNTPLTDLVAPFRLDTGEELV